MKLLIYLAAYGIILPLSKLSFRILYYISDGIFILVYYVLGYRKKVVRENLKNAFPEKTEQEIQDIMRQFYRNFCDLIVESIKFFSITPEEAKKRCPIENPEVVDNLYDKYPCVFALTGHIGNWEFAGIGAGLFWKFWPAASYKPFSNAVFDKIMRDVRSRYMSVIPYYDIKRIALQTIETGKFIYNTTHTERKPVFIFLTDQAPSKKNTHYWTTFLNQETAFYTKIESMAKELAVPVIFCDLQRIKRGQFNIHLTLLTENAALEPHLFITNQYITLLEKSIRKNPANWLWSHKRWKRKKEHFHQQVSQQ